jgi:flagellar hook-associated protein 1 FlgK
VFAVGNDVSNSSAELTSAQSILNQFQDQRGAISGVSLNEEAANMVQFQNAFNAAAEVVTTINDMPRSCAEAGVLQRVVSLEHIPEQILLATRYRKHA